MVRIKSKEELLEIINDHFVTQQNFALKLKEKAEKYTDIDDDEDDSNAKKKRRSYLSAYNAQVDAVSKTVVTLIKINNSSLQNEEEQEEEFDSLVD